MQYWPYILIFSLYLYLNSINILGSFSLFMDERLVFDGIKSIYSANNFYEFVYAIIDGGDQRYGRGFWNINAVFAFIPFKLFGDSGIIYTERISGTIAILISLKLLLAIFIKRNNLRIFCLVTILVLPFTNYYMINPKPEPLQLLSFATYLYLSHNKRDYLGLKCILLGAVAGMKVSGFILVVVTVLFIFALDVHRLRQRKMEFLRAIGFMLIGFCAVVPTMFISVILGVLLLIFTSQKVSLLKKTISLFLSSLLVVYLSKKIANNFHNYRSWTSESIAHGSDSSSVNALSWINYIFQVWFNGNIYLSIIIISSFFIMTLKVIFTIRIQKKVLPVIIFPVLVFVTTIPIMFGVHRLSGYYLWNSSIYFVLFIFAGIDLWLIDKNILIRYLSLSSVFVLIFSLGFSEIYKIEVTSYINYEKSVSYLEQKNVYHSLLAILQEASLKKKVKIAYDPILWLPDSQPNMQIIPFWGPFVGWEEGYDYIILSGSNFGPQPSANTSDGKIRALTDDNFLKYIVPPRTACEATCYVIENQFGSTRLLKRVV